MRTFSIATLMVAAIAASTVVLFGLVLVPLLARVMTG